MASPTQGAGPPVTFDKRFPDGGVSRERGRPLLPFQTREDGLPIEDKLTAIIQEIRGHFQRGREQDEKIGSLRAEIDLSRRVCADEKNRSQNRRVEELQTLTLNLKRELDLQRRRGEELQDENIKLRVMQSRLIFTAVLIANLVTYALLSCYMTSSTNRTS